MKINFNSFEKALQQLEKSIAYLNSEQSQNDTGLHEQFRAAVIQAFEYSFELSWKFLKRHLEMVAGETDIDTFSKKDLFRVGFEKGLIKTSETWFEYLAARNQTSHTYDAQSAEEVCTIAQQFVGDARALLDTLKQKTKNHV